MKPPIFFLRSIGRVLPGLTEVVIEFEALKQRVEIEEELLRLKLRQKCFLALAERNPESTVLSPPSISPALPERTLQNRIKIFPGAAVAPLQIQPGPSAGILHEQSDAPQTSDSNNREPKPAGVFGFYPKGRW